MTSVITHAPVNFCPLPPAAVARQRHPRDNARLASAKTMFEILVFVDGNNHATIDEIQAGIDFTVCKRTIYRYVCALEELNLIRGKFVQKADSKGMDTYFESTVRLTVKGGTA